MTATLDRQHTSKLGQIATIRGDGDAIDRELARLTAGATRRVYTTTEAAALIGCPKNGVTRLADQGRVEKVHRGVGRYDPTLYDAESVDRLVAEQAGQAPIEPPVQEQEAPSRVYRRQTCGGCGHEKALTAFEKTGRDEWREICRSCAKVVDAIGVVSLPVRGETSIELDEQHRVEPVESSEITVHEPGDGRQVVRALHRRACEMVEQLAGRHELAEAFVLEARAYAHAFEALTGEQITVGAS